jgi:hypothetical protein
MKTSKRIYIVLLALLAVGTGSFALMAWLNGYFDFFSFGTAALSGKALMVVMFSINLSTLGQPADAKYVDGSENMGGFGMVGYLAIRSHIATYPTLDTTGATLADLVQLVGNYVFNSNRHFIEIHFVEDSIKVTNESQGEHPGGSSYKISGEGFIAGTDTTRRGLARLLNNSYGVVILKREDGTRIAFGDYERPVSFKVTVDEGQKAADKKGLVVTFSGNSFVPGYEYYGTIPLSGSVTLPAIPS